MKNGLKFILLDVSIMLALWILPLSAYSMGKDESVMKAIEENSGLALMAFSGVLTYVIFLHTAREISGRRRAREKTELEEKNKVEINKLREMNRKQEIDSIRDLISQIEDNRQLEHNSLKAMVEEQSKAVEKSLVKISDMADIFMSQIQSTHGRITELSEEFHELKGEHDAIIPKCVKGDKNG